MKINIAIGTDGNYVRQACVLMQSIMDNADGFHEYAFFVLLDNTVSTESRKLFLDFSEKYDNCQMNFIQMQDQIIAPYIGRLRHLTQATYYRLLLPDLLKEEKCIYLDTDIIVCGDIAEIYNTPMDNYVVAGVKAPNYHLLADQGKEYMEKTGLPSMDQYINAGVLLLDLDKLRKENFTQKALPLIHKANPTEDQDIINLVCYDKIKHLPFKYNVPVAYHLEKRAGIAGKVFPQEEWEEGFQNPAIIHFCGPLKPWEYFNVPFADKWWEACRHLGLFTNFAEEKLAIFYYYGVICQKPLWKCEEFSSGWYEELRKFSHIYVYGAGEKGCKLIRILQQNNIHIEAAVVSEKDKNLSLVENVEVVEFTREISKNALMLLGVSISYIGEIREKLFHEGYMNVFIFQDI